MEIVESFNQKKLHISFCLLTAGLSFILFFLLLLSGPLFLWLCFPCTSFFNFSVWFVVSFLLLLLLLLLPSKLAPGFGSRLLCLETVCMCACVCTSVQDPSSCCFLCIILLSQPGRLLGFPSLARSLLLMACLHCAALPTPWPFVYN